MKTILQWASLCASILAFGVFPADASAQTTPTLQGTSVADPAVPVLITPAPASSGFFVLNQDFSVLQHSLVDTSQNQSCPGPSVFSQTNPAARTLVVDQYNAYLSGPDAPGYNSAITALTPEVSCTPVQPFDYTGGVGTQALASNDPQHALYYLVNALGGSSVDELIVLPNLNSAAVSSSGKFPTSLEAALDTGGVYTSVVSDTRSNFGLTAITELKTSTSPGNLFVYSPQTSNVYRILGPGGTKLPAVTSFIIPPQIDGGGSLLVLVNQDGLTASNYTAPPQDTTPFTIIDLGQLQAVLATSPAKNTVTLPFVTQIKATTPFYAMLGAAYNPINHRIYAVVGGGTSTSNIVESILSYDTLNPAAPAEVVVADVSNVPFSLGSYPQIALNAASGTMQILTSNPSMLYTVGITGTGNSAVSVAGSTFPDSNFQPTYIGANALLGETYIASASGQVDVLTRPTTTQAGLTLTLSGSDLGYTSQQYEVKPLALYPVYDPSLSSAMLTITATPDGGTPVTVATAHVSDVGYPGSSFFTYTFPAAGRYTLVATAAASANYPAVTSPPLYVYVGNTGVYPTSVALSIPATVAATNGSATLNATVTLSGTTYAPTGQVYIKDPSGAEVGNIQLPKGVISNPLSIPVTIGQGNQTLTAVYSGDDQNQASQSAPQTITVGTVTKVTPLLTVTLPGTAVTGASVTGSLSLTSTSTTVPTGTVTIYAALSGGASANQIATVPASQAFAAGGMSFTFTAPVAGTYTVFAGYGGDSSYSNAVSSNATLTVTAAQLQTTSVGLVVPGTATPGTAFNVVVAFNVQGAYTTQPTGNITLTAISATGTATTIGTVTPAQAMAPGGANITTTLANAGTYTLTATYAGDALYAASSNMASVTLNGFATTLSVTAAASQTVGKAFNATIALTSTQSTTSPTGNVVLTAVNGTGAPFTVATITAAQAAQSGGYAVSITPAASGTYALTATYGGDSRFTGSTAGASIKVAAIATTVTLQAPASFTPNTPFSAVVQFSSASSSGSPATGNITITATPAGGAAITVGSLVVSQAAGTGGYTAQITLPSSSNYTLTATYAGDSAYSTSSGTASIVPFAPSPTTLSLSGPATVLPGASFVTTVTLKATGSTTATITGNITVTAKSLTSFTPITLGTVSAAAAMASGGVQISSSIDTQGVFNVTATYAGDANYTESQGLIVVSVSLPTTSLTLSGATNQMAGVAFPLTVTLKPQAGFSGTPTGNVVLSTTVSGTTTTLATVTAAQALTAGGYPAQVTLPTGGSYVVQAQYAGDSNFLGSMASLLITTSSTATLTLRAVPATGLIVNTNFQLCVDLSSMTTTATPTGSFTLSATDPNLNPVDYPSISAASSLAKTACTGPIQTTMGGTYTFTATYPGDSNYPPLVATLQLIFQPQTTSLKLTGAATATALSPYQVTTTLTTAATKPTGNIILTATLNGSSTALTTLYIDPIAALTGVTSFITFPAAGTYTVSVNFPGDNNVSGSTATPLIVVVAPAPASNFTLTLDDPSVNTNAGALTQSGSGHTTTVTLTTVAGSGPGPVTLSASGSYAGVIVFRDAVTMKLITTATPTAAGTKIIVEYDSTTPTAAIQWLDIHKPALPISFAGGLFGLFLFRLRRSKLRDLQALYLPSAVAFIVTAASVMAGCASSVYTQCSITAAPVTASAAAPPQSVVILTSKGSN